MHHRYNAWLPPPVANATSKEKQSFSTVVTSVKQSYSTDDPESVYSTLKWISVINMFIKAKSDVSPEDITLLVEFGLQVFNSSQDKLYVQVRWGNVLVTLLNNFRKKLTLKVNWRPFYDTLVQTHFTRNTGPEGWRIRQRHFETVTTLILSCRRFFPPGSAHEIWSEFRSLLENPWHNSAFEGSGFVRLFLPTNLDNQDFYSREWIDVCIFQWDSIPNCKFWNSQWADVMARVIKNYKFKNWEDLLPEIFSRFLNMFGVPVASGGGAYPFSIYVPGNTKFLFSNKSKIPAKAIAKSIVYLLRPGSSAQQHFDKLVNLLEQYYHPSNGGRWTNSLERFLFHLVYMFRKRLQREKENPDSNEQSGFCLGQPERESFVRTVLKLIDRGQYSKNENLSETVASATSILSYVEPALVLPFLVSRFHMAIETMTATHQLKTAVTSVAFSGRSLFLKSLSASTLETNGVNDDDTFRELLMISLNNALLGMDANDPPKTLATMQLIASIFSNMTTLDDDDDDKDNLAFMPVERFSEWLDEFLCRLFSLLQHLEPSSVLNEDAHSPATSGTFLVEDGSQYFCMLEILFGRLSRSLYNQAIKKVSKFLKTSILPGAITEVGLLCCACIHSNPELAVNQVVEPLLSSIISALKGSPLTGFGGSGNFSSQSLNKARSTLSPALETSVEYQLKVLSIAITYGGHSVLSYKDQFKEAIHSAFESPAWKVNIAGDQVLRALLGCLVLYYPVDQYMSDSQHSSLTPLEEWISNKDFSNDEVLMGPTWHIPSEEEIQFVNDLLNLHLESALDELLKICQDNIHSDPGSEKDHLKVTLLRIDSSLHGVLSCLPDFIPSFKNGKVEDPPFLIAGATGSIVGRTGVREKAADVIHVASKYLLEKKSDDSILLLLLIRIIKALGNYGSGEFEEWNKHRQAWKVESDAIIEPPVNFIVPSNSKGKKRPRWALIDKAYMHNTWRASQSSYNLYRTSENASPSENVNVLVNDLLNLCVHSYDTVRELAGKSLVKLIKRWPCLIAKCVLTLTENLRSLSSPEYMILGSCAVLGTSTVLKHLNSEPKSLSFFLLGILLSSQHESLKSQKAINELFFKYNICFEGVSRNIFNKSEDHSGTDFAALVSEIGSVSFESSNLHWRYNLMANRVLLLLAMSSRNEPNLSSKILNKAAGHFLTNLKSQLPQTRILAISALNMLLKESPYKVSSVNLQENTKSSLEGTLSNIFQEEQFFTDTFDSLANVHIISDTENSSRGNIGNSSFQSFADKSITHFYFNFSSSWPRTLTWISSFATDAFYPSSARIFKRLVQECGVMVLLSLKTALNEFVNSEERSKQCVAAEAFAGLLHADVIGLVEEWDNWMMAQLENIILAPSVESVPEWAACIRYAVTGKGKYGTKIPVLRQRILDCLVEPLPQTVTTTVVAKRYSFLSAALIEISPLIMPLSEVQVHYKLLQELLDNMSHPTAHVREAIAIALSVLCSNIRLHASVNRDYSFENGKHTEIGKYAGSWDKILLKKASELVVAIQNASPSDSLDNLAETNTLSGSDSNSPNDVQWMETLFHFVISLMKSGRSAFLLDVLVGFIYPVISLQETSNKDLSILAKAAFELLKWRIFTDDHLRKVVLTLLSLAEDPNWRTRSATLTFLRSFMYRHTFILSDDEKQKIWKAVEKLLTDNQVEVREHAAAVLAGLMKGEDGVLSKDFRERAYAEAMKLQKRRKQRSSSGSSSVASIHGCVLALAACVLSVPYDMPSWLPEHATLLARFVGEPSPVKSTVTKAVAEFRRTHADTWSVQKDYFTEEQLEVLADTSSSSSYFA